MRAWENAHTFRTTTMGDVDVKLAQPPAVRSCRDGGEWDFCRDPSTGGNCMLTELGQLDALAPADRHLTRQELHAKLRRAEKGNLTFGTASEGADVTMMEVAPTVLELRLKTRRGQGGAMLIRLYFTEPEARAGLILGLKLAWKRPGPIGLDEQNDHARNAAYRAEKHLGTL